ncbi:MAG: DUF3054 domain-containing protein [Acidimicrobiales bacterium]
MADLAAVPLLVGIGRAVHAHGLGVAGLASTAWPFSSGLAAAWIALAVRRRDGASSLDGLVVWISTVALGMALRVISGQGIAVAFVLVALGFLGTTMLGWRPVTAGLRPRRLERRTS